MKGVGPHKIIDTTQRYFGIRRDSGNRQSSFKKNRTHPATDDRSSDFRDSREMLKKIMIRFFFSPRSFSRTVQQGNTVKCPMRDNIFQTCFDPYLIGQI